MKEWFNSQSPRDQVALLLLAGSLAVFGLFQFALAPASEGAESDGTQQPVGQCSAQSCRDES
jgi:hypothetical protein